MFRKSLHKLIGLVFLTPFLILFFVPSLLAATPAPAAKNWQQEWNSLVEAAKKEGKITISTQIGSEVRQALTASFKSKYGIDMEFIVGRAGEILPKVTAERLAGIYSVDVHLEGLSGQFEFYKAGFIEKQLESFLILPEVVDPKAWYGGEGINYIGKTHYTLSFLSRPMIQLVSNNQLVKPAEIKSYRDLLNPKWKGKIILQDPTVGGAGQAVITMIAWYIMNQDYLKELAKQELMITRDKRLMVEWVARGKYPLMIAPDSTVYEEFARVGAPLTVLWPVEGAALSSGHGCLSLLNNARHPAAAKLFINWLLSREGQTVIARAAGSQSARVDTPFDWVEPDRRIKQGYKYFQADTEESVDLRMKTRELSSKIFGHLLK